MMKYVQRVFGIAVCFALQSGIAAFTSTGWTLSVLPMLTIIAVWRDQQDVCSGILLPTALLLDFVHPIRFPLVSLTVLSVWGVSWLVQRSWLTNRSAASLVGVALVGIAMRLGTTVGGTTLANLFGVTSSKIEIGWDVGPISLLLGMEVSITVVIGLLIQWVGRVTHRRFFYGAR